MVSDLNFKDEPGDVQHTAAVAAGSFTVEGSLDNTRMAATYTIGGVDTDIDTGTGRYRADVFYMGIAGDGSGIVSFDMYPFDGNYTDGNQPYSAYRNGSFDADSGADAKLGMIDSANQTFMVVDSYLPVGDTKLTLGLGLRDGSGLDASLLNGEYLALHLRYNHPDAYATRRLHITADGSGASGLFVGANSPVRISGIDYVFERADVYRNRFEKNRLSFKIGKPEFLAAQHVPEGNIGIPLVRVDCRKRQSYNHKQQNHKNLSHIPNHFAPPS